MKIRSSCALFSIKCCTHIEKKHVREHKHKFDAQEIFKKLVSHYAKSKARVNASETLSHFTSAKLGSWKRTSEYFMLNWKNQTLLCESLVKIDRHIPDDLKKNLLVNAVKSNSELRDVKDQTDQMHAQIGRELTCDQCSTLFLSASTKYDSQFNSMSAKTSRRFYHAEIGDNNFDQESPSEVTEDFDCNIDASATTLLVNINNLEITNSNSYLPPEDYNLLTPNTDYGENYLMT